MSLARLRSRTPSARRIDRAVLPGHQLRFHKLSLNDGSAKCDAFATGNPQDLVHGVVYELAAQDKPGLDRVEGLGHGYMEKTVRVQRADGTAIEVFTYIATLVDPERRPFDWYLRHVLAGARENGLPDMYQRMIEAIACDPDPDQQRGRRELAIYD